MTRPALRTEADYLMSDEYRLMLESPDAGDLCADLMLPLALSQGFN